MMGFRLNSLQRRLAIGIGSGIVFMWLAATVTVIEIVRHEMNEVFDTALSEVGQSILNLPDLMRQRENTGANRPPVLADRHHYITYIVRDQDDRVLLQSHDADPSIFPPVSAQGFSEANGHRIYSDTALDGGVTIAVAEPLSHRQQAEDEAAVALMLAGVGLLVIVLCVVVLLTRLMLKPLNALRNAISVRDASDLSPVELNRLPDELEPIRAAVNGLLNRLRQAIDAERRLAANAAHELRTPLAAAAAQTQQLLRETSDPKAVSRGKVISAGLCRLSRLVGKLAEKTRAEAVDLIGTETADMRRPLELVIRELSVSHPGRPTPVLHLPDAPALSRLDMDAYAIVARNLIENAMLHGAEDQPVEIAMNDRAVLTVTNAGPVIPEAEMETYLEPFSRGEHGAGGSGLGLAIVNAIVKGARSRLSMVSPAPGRDDGVQTIFYPLDTGPQRT